MPTTVAVHILADVDPPLADGFGRLIRALLNYLLTLFRIRQILVGDKHIKNTSHIDAIFPPQSIAFVVHTVGLR